MGRFRSQRSPTGSACLSRPVHGAFLVRIKLTSHGRTSFEQFQQAVLRIPEVQVVQLMLGDYDFNVRVVVRDMDHFHALLQNQLVLLPGLQEIQSSVLLDELKYTTQLPL